MFEKASDIRARQREKMIRKAREKGRKAVIAEVRRRLQGATIEKDPATGMMILTLTVSPDDVEYLLGERSEADGGC